MNHRIAIVAMVGLGTLVMALTGCTPGATGDFTRPPYGVEDYVRGVRAIGQGSPDQAILAMSHAVQKNPDLTMARIVLGDLYYNQGQISQAAEQYEVVTRLDPYDPKNHYKLGVTYQLLDRLQEAAASYLRALKLDPNDARAAMNLGLVYLGLNQPADGERWIRRATELAPESAAAWANLGVALDALGRYSEAESVYRKSIELDSEQVTTLLNLGSNLVLQGKGADAARALEQVVQKSDSAVARKRYGDALALQKLYDQALVQYQAALALNPRYTPAMNEMGRALVLQYRQGLELDDAKRQEAISVWKQSLQINPNQPDVENMIRQWQQHSTLRP